MADINLSSLFTSTSGNGTTDDTAIFKQALQLAQGGTLYIPKASVAYRINDLVIPSNVHIVFEAGTLVKAVPGVPIGRPLLSLNGATNVTIDGNGSTIQMLKSEYTSGEWTHVFDIENCSNVTINNITARDSGGDGFYVNGVTNVTLNGVVADNNKRNGISVISANGLLVENSIFKNTNGTAPEYGIDVEPNGPSDLLKNVVFQNCLCQGNAQTGVGVSLTMYQSATSRIDVGLTFNNVTTVSNGANGMELYVYNSNKGIGGTVNVNNYTSNGDRGIAMTIANYGTLSPHVAVNGWNYLNPSSTTRSLTTYPSEVRDSSGISSGYIAFKQAAFTATVPTGTSSTTTTTTPTTTTPTTTTPTTTTPTTTTPTTTTPTTTTPTTTTPTTTTSGVINGTTGNNTINGTSGNDTIYGLAGNDTLSGGTGNDILWGGAGTDLLTGGTGKDVYKFGKGDGADTIVASTSNYEDTVMFNAGTKTSDISVKLLSNKDLVINCGSADTLTVKSWSYNSTTALSTFQIEGSSQKYKLTMTNGVASWSTIA